MSYILDALKKVEHEKAKMAKSGGMANISGGLFLERMPNRSKRPGWKMAVAILLGALAAFSVAWFVLNGARSKKKPAIASPPSVAQSRVVPPVAAPSAPPSPALPSPAPPAPAPQVVAAPAPVPPPPGEAGERTASGRKASKVAPPQQPKPHVQTVQAPADIKVAGIAWQENRSARRAVVNGYLLQEGSVVSGAKISEIHQEKVTFSSPAGVFEVKLDAASIPASPK